MEFTPPDDDLAQHEDDAQRWVRDHLPELALWAEEQRRSGDYHTPELHRRLADAGWYAAGWPAEYGGNDIEPHLARAVMREIGRAGVHQDGWGSTFVIISTLLHVATEEQKTRFIGGALRGEVILVLGYSEPDAGSDVAAAKTRALSDGDEWVVNGQKMFTSTAHLATHVFLLTRTNIDAPKHKGLTMFIADLDDPGVEIHPVRTLGGQRTNATYYSDVRLRDDCRIGAIDGGWGVMNVALVFERGGVEGSTLGGTTSRALAQRVAQWCQQTRRDDGTLVWDDPTVRERLARMTVDIELSRMLELRANWLASGGDMSGVGGAAAKLFTTESSQRHAWDLLDIIGEEAVLKREADNAPLGAEIEELFRYGVVSTLYGGSSEIMRDIIAERQLGLPRVRPK